MSDEEQVYKGKKIVIKTDNTGLKKLYIDGTFVEVLYDAETRKYWCNKFAYQNFSSLLELARRLVDQL